MSSLKRVLHFTIEWRKPHRFIEIFEEIVLCQQANHYRNNIKIPEWCLGLLSCLCVHKTTFYVFVCALCNVYVWGLLGVPWLWESIWWGRGQSLRWPHSGRLLRWSDRKTGRNRSSWTGTPLGKEWTGKSVIHVFGLNKNLITPIREKRKTEMSRLGD